MQEVLEKKTFVFMLHQNNLFQDSCESHVSSLAEAAFVLVVVRFVHFSTPQSSWTEPTQVQ